MIGKKYGIYKNTIFFTMVPCLVLVVTIVSHRVVSCQVKGVKTLNLHKLNYLIWFERIQIHLS
jgi:hypothetical protein